MAVIFDPKKYWENRLKQNYDLIGVGDISLTINYNTWSYKISRIVLKKLFKKYLPKKIGAVLDIGSGTGFVIDIWQEFGVQVNGIDISATAVKNLTEKYPCHKFYEIDAGSQSLPFLDNSLQAVSASSVLYHVIDDESLDELLKSVHRVLESGGFFIFSDNFIHGKNLNITHQKCRTLEDYERALQKNGFEIIDRVANYVLFNDPVDASSKFYPRIWGFLTSFSKKWKWFDTIIWPMLFPLEFLLTLNRKESPAQEIMICKSLK
jgi:ubiquinone/menaquinone biosynthesis C-methylase UbiE